MPIALLNAKMTTSNRMHGGVLALGLLMGRHIREAKERVRGVGMRSAARKGTIRASVGEKLLVEFGARVDPCGVLHGYVALVHLLA